MKANEAYNSRIVLECNCTGISSFKWDSLMEGAVKANGRTIRQMIKKQLPDLYEELALEFPNPHESRCVRTNKHLVYVHSAIEYFLKIV